MLAFTPAHSSIEKSPKWEETRIRINPDCVKVERKNVNARTFVDPKADFELVEKIVFMSSGQLPYGEWLKRLSESDTSPRGSCRNHFKKKAHFRAKTLS